MHSAKSSMKISFPLFCTKLKEKCYSWQQLFWEFKCIGSLQQLERFDAWIWSRTSDARSVWEECKVKKYANISLRSPEVSLLHRSLLNQILFWKVFKKNIVSLEFLEICTRLKTKSQAIGWIRLHVSFPLNLRKL